MSPSDRDRIETQLVRLWNQVEAVLIAKFPEQHESIEFRCYFDPADDMPYWVRLGEVYGEHYDVHGFTAKHALARFQVFGVQMIRGRLAMDGARREAR